jgi:CubicO group peptidase (beta-lactamase class C family)
MLGLVRRGADVARRVEGARVERRGIVFRNWGKLMGARQTIPLLAICVLAFVLVLAPAHAAAQQSTSLPNYWSDYFERSLGRAPAGYAFAVREGDETWADAAGLERLARNGRDGVAMRADAVVHLASISKTITALALLNLLEERRIEVDAPFWPYLQPAFSGIATGARVDQITFAQVLAHRSGLPSMEINPPMMANLSRQLGEDTVSAPGETFLYSNLNYTIARALIEVISGERYENYVRASCWRRRARAA